MSQQNHTQH